MTINSKIIIPETLLLQKIDEDTILLDINTQEYFQINEVGTLIWEILSEKKELSEVKKEIATLYDIDEDQIEIDIFNFLEALNEKGLINID